FRSLSCSAPAGRRALRSFPTRRSSDLVVAVMVVAVMVALQRFHVPPRWRRPVAVAVPDDDRPAGPAVPVAVFPLLLVVLARVLRSEEHTSELQSREHLVCRPLLEKNNA